MRGDAPAAPAHVAEHSSLCSTGSLRALGVVTGGSLAGRRRPRLGVMNAHQTRLAANGTRYRMPEQHHMSGGRLNARP